MPPAIAQMSMLPTAIGYFVMEWTKHERMVAKLVSIAEGRDYELVRDKLLDGPVKCYEDRLRELAAAIPEGSAAQAYFARILDEHPVLREVRHDVVHGFFLGITPDDEFIMKRKIRKGPERIEPLTAETVLAFYHQLQALGETVMNAGRALQGKKPIGEA